MCAKAMKFTFLPSFIPSVGFRSVRADPCRGTHPLDGLRENGLWGQLDSFCQRLGPKPEL